MKRRRLLIALTLLLCLGAFVAWKLSWRGDPRFVGSWTVAKPESQSPTVTMAFHADGTGALYVITNPSKDPVLRTAWWLEDGRFFIRHQPKETGLALAKVLAHDAWLFLTGESVSRPVLEYRIEQRAPDRWHFQGASDSGTNEDFEIVRQADESGSDAG